jgi:hypothetical protein
MFIVGLIVNRILIPSGDFEDKKCFYSRKYKVYSLKLQIITDRLRFCISIHSVFTDIIHDFPVFDEKIKDIGKLFD